MKCEICDRNASDVDRDAMYWYEIFGEAIFMGIPNPYPGPLPRNEGAGWMVRFFPRREEYLRLSFSDSLKVAQPILYQIATCGSAVCILRAKNNGVPGKVYK